MVDYPLSPGVLKSVRECRDLDIPVAATAIGIPPEQLERLEDGEEQPNLGLLRKIAKTYRFPLATLAHPTPLERHEPITDFRTIEGVPATLSLPLSIALDEAGGLQAFATELIVEDDQLLVSEEAPAITLDDDPEALGAAERDRLGLNTAVQFGSRDAADLFNFVRTKIEAQGILVYRINVPLSDCRGFCLVEDEGPTLIAFNDEDPLPEAKLFTLVHEYCHALLSAPGISGNELRNPTERFCNLFAAAFLMPPEVVDHAAKRAGSPTEWDRDAVANVARRLRVSQQALALRLDETGRAPSGFYERWMADLEGVEPPIATAPGFVPYERRLLRTFGTAYAGLVLGALDKGVVSELDAYRMLKVKPEHLDALREELEGRKARVAAAGG